jgi:hypothetical protein
VLQPFDAPREDARLHRMSPAGARCGGAGLSRTARLVTRTPGAEVLERKVTALHGPFFHENPEAVASGQRAPFSKADEPSREIHRP